VLGWKRQLGTSDSDLSHGIATDGKGNVYISGHTEGSLGGVDHEFEDALVSTYYTRR
jgi:hypothetical protein